MAKHITAAAGLLATLVFAGTAYADTVFGVYAGAGVWQQDYSGDVTSGPEAVDLQSDLDISDQNNNVLYVAIEHPVPLLPNVRLNYSDISTDGRNVVTRSFQFQGQNFTVSDDVSSKLDLTQTDAVFYYELLDNVVSLDLGLAARFMDGKVELTSTAATAQAEFKGALPMLYGRARADLPFTGIWLGAEAMGLSYDGHSFVDANAQVGWESSVGLGAEVGWRTINLDLDTIDDIDSAQIDVSGPYAAVNFHF